MAKPRAGNIHLKKKLSLSELRNCVKVEVAILGSRP